MNSQPAGLPVVQHSICAGRAPVRATRVSEQIESAMGKAVSHCSNTSGGFCMFAVGVDISNGRSTVAVLGTRRIVVIKPHEVPHTADGFAELAAANFATVPNWLAFDWRSHYRRARINVDIAVSPSTNP